MESTQTRLKYTIHVHVFNTIAHLHQTIDLFFL